jgi:hypothetical protein
MRERIFSLALREAQVLATTEHDREDLNEDNCEECGASNE